MLRREWGILGAIRVQLRPISRPEIAAFAPIGGMARLGASAEVPARRPRLLTLFAARTHHASIVWRWRPFWRDCSWNVPRETKPALERSVRTGIPQRTR